MALVRNKDKVKLSKEMAKAKIAPAATPGLMTPRVIFEERAHRMGAEALGGLLEGQIEVGQRSGDRANHVGRGDDDMADQKGRIRSLHLEQGIELQERDAGQDLRQEQGRGNESVEHVAAAEAVRAPGRGRPPCR